MKCPKCKSPMRQTVGRQMETLHTCMICGKIVLPGAVVAMQMPPREANQKHSGRKSING